MRLVLIFKLGGRRNSIPTNCEIECHALFLGCPPQSANGYCRCPPEWPEAFPGASIQATAWSPATDGGCGAGLS